jgi:hypothetical protein
MQGDAEAVAVEVLQRPALLEEVMACLLDDDRRVSGRAAYVMMRTGEEQPELLWPYKNLLLGEIATIPLWTLRYRLCQVIPKLNLTPAEIAQAFDLYQSFLADKSGAVRSFSLSGMAELAALDTRLRPEAIEIIEDRMRTGTPAMRARGRKMLAKLYQDERAGG